MKLKKFLPVHAAKVRLSSRHRFNGEQLLQLSRLFVNKSERTNGPTSVRHGKVVARGPSCGCSNDCRTVAQK
ncbi:hypothetical protein M514_24665 [Trichuris suis]|uniref:Uncharacterized protein n=1 Tax=Trichuris suis TaxID=68888 RepID=A0A085N144_9BILA|nr:hypothetical protein M514_24665 [Trichuris suis]